MAIRQVKKYLWREKANIFYVKEQTFFPHAIFAKCRVDSRVTLLYSIQSKLSKSLHSQFKGDILYIQVLSG